MYAIVGATGKTGAAAVATLLAAGKEVRPLVRKREQLEAFAARGVQAAMADLNDAASLERAFNGCEAAYLMNPPGFMGQDLFADARAIHKRMVEAANAAGLRHVVALSSIGAHLDQGTGNILTAHDLETQLGDFKGSATMLRACGFQDNWTWLLGPVLSQSVLPSNYLPIDRPFPNVAAIDIGAVAAQLLIEARPGVAGLEGPLYSPVDVAATYSKLLGRPIQTVAVEPSQWPALFAARGLNAVAASAFTEMYSHFNSGWIRFEGTEAMRRGTTTLETTLQGALNAMPQGVGH